MKARDLKGCIILPTEGVIPKSRKASARSHLFREHGVNGVGESLSAAEQIPPACSRPDDDGRSLHGCSG